MVKFINFTAHLFRSSIHAHFLTFSQQTPLNERNLQQLLRTAALSARDDIIDSAIRNLQEDMIQQFEIQHRDLTDILDEQFLRLQRENEQLRQQNAQLKQRRSNQQQQQQQQNDSNTKTTAIVYQR